jgi:hypothetical protein
MRRSGIVLLSLPLAVVAVAPLIPEGQQMRRNVYADRASCERDYSPPQCEQSGPGPGGSFGYAGGGWHGPYYAANRPAPGTAADPGPGRIGLASSVETSVRGGFGAFGRAMHAVG